MKRSIFSIVMVCSVSMFSFGQDREEYPNFFKIKEREERNFDKDDKAEDGKKAKFLRWYHLWRYRLGEDGDMTAANRMYHEYLEKSSKDARSSSCDSPLDNAINWTNLGPHNSTGALDAAANGSNECAGLLPDMQNQGRVEAISANPNNVNEILVGGLNGGMWRSTDGGASWINTTDDEGYSIYGITSIVRHPQNANIVYASTSLGGGTWRAARTVYGMGVIVSTDGGISWQPTGMTYSNFGQWNSQLGSLAIDPNSTLSSTKLYVVSNTDVWRWNGGYMANAAWSSIYSNNTWYNGPLWWGYIHNNDIEVAGDGTVWFTNYLGVYKYSNGSVAPVSNYNVPNPYTVSAVVCPMPQFMRRHTNLEINKQGHIVMLMVYNNCVGSNGVGMYLYRSTNNGQSWSFPVNITGHSGHNFSNRYPMMAVDPDNSDIIIVEAPDRCIKRSDDFGATFNYTGQ